MDINVNVKNLLLVSSPISFTSFDGSPSRRSVGRRRVQQKRARAVTWEDVLDVAGERPVQQRVQQHHEDGDQEAVARPLFRTLCYVGPLDAQALLLVLGEVLAAVAEGHARQQALGRGSRGRGLAGIRRDDQCQVSNGSNER